LGAAELFADLLRRVTLQAQLKDPALVRVKIAEQLLDGFGEDGGLFGRRFVAGGVEHGLRGRGRGFARDVAPLRTMVTHAIGALAQRDGCQQTPQTLPTLRREGAVAVAKKKTLVR